MLHLIDITTNPNLAVIECITDAITARQLIYCLVARDDIRVHFKLSLVLDEISVSTLHS